MKTSSTKEKPGLFTRIGNFFSEVRTETEKVSWPSKDQVKTYTTVVIVSSIICGILIGLWDFLLTELIKTIFSFGA
ncbi:MAG: preprotein translocase subunit SecE [Candidatus Sumerlaeia bacterium]|nr:preprotein translocase subunit SecE [Candidatus Sumerlaeia bacterium]